MVETCVRRRQCGMLANLHTWLDLPENLELFAKRIVFNGR
jgi:hypothetical protein